MTVIDLVPNALSSLLIKSNQTMELPPPGNCENNCMREYLRIEFILCHLFICE